MDSTLYRIALASVRGITPILANEWISRLGSEEAFFTAGESTLTSLAGKRLSVFDSGYRRELLDRTRGELDFIDRYNICPIYFTDPRFPVRLAQCDDSPLMLYTLGDCNLDAPHVVSIVGTRHSTPYGADFVRRLIADLAAALDDLIVVSGLAYGTDVSAHRACVEAGVPTVGVLAHGLNKIYPAVHRDIADRMVHSGGMLLTEYNSTDYLSKANFLSRNRIIAGLADCTVVVESDLKGGSLSTAAAAAEYSRDVMALPGRTSDRYSRGCNRLIATNVGSLITDAADLMAVMGWKGRCPEGTQTTLPVDFTDEERAVVDCLRRSGGELSINDLSAALQSPVHALMSLLVEMEFNGLILSMPGARYRLA